MLFKTVDNIYHDSVYKRADDTGCVFYFSSADFPSLHCESYPFFSSLGHTLSGYFYYYDGYRENRIVMFEHGMGSGHRGYMKEIETLARHGYLVFSYDHTGCMESGGETTGGFSQSLCDLNDALCALKADEKYKDFDFSVIGHSWGGFSTLNISAFHDVKHQIALAGYISVEQILKQFFSGPLSPFFKRIYQRETQQHGVFAKSDAITALKKTSAKVLIIHSDDDKTLKCQKHFDIMKAELENRGNIAFLKVHGKNHNPNYTEDAVKYMNAFFADYKKIMNKPMSDEEKKAFRESYDWNAMTKQDGKIWEEIFRVLDN